MARLTVLCGTGMTELATSTEGAEVETFRSDTPWGDVPCTLIRNNGHEILFIYRHHRPDGKVNPPHSIEHRANIHAAISFQPGAVVSVWCVGSMDHDFPPGVVGVAEGKTSGDMFYWAYTIDLPTPSGERRVSFKDYMWMLSDDRVLNKAYMSKWGLPLGEVTIMFEKDL